jgi:hypothetical protein
MIAVLEANPRVGLAFSDFALFSEDGGPLVRKSSTLRIFPRLTLEPLAPQAFLLPEDAFSYLLEEQPIFPSALVLRRAFYEDVGLFTREIRRADALSVEWEFLLRAARRSRLAYVADPLCRVRKHAGNISGVNRLMVQGTVEVLETVLARHRLTRSQRRIARRQAALRSWSVGRDYAEAHEFREARRWFARSLGHAFRVRVAGYWVAALAPGPLFERLRRVKRRLGSPAE